MELVATSQAEAGAGPGGGRAAVRRGAARGHRRPGHARAGRAVPAAPATGAAGQGRPDAGRGHPAHVEPRPRRRLQRQPDQGSPPPDRGARGQGYTVELHAVGKKGVGVLQVPRPRAGVAAAGRRRPADGRPRGRASSRPLIEAYRRRRAASVDLVYAKFISALRPRRPPSRILPVEPPRPQAGAPARDYILAPERRGDPRRAAAAVRPEHGLPRRWSRPRRRSTARGAPP